MQAQKEKKINWLLGLVWVGVVLFTAGIALPFVNVPKQFTPEQLMVFRGYIAALFVVIWTFAPRLWRSSAGIGEIDKYACLIGAILPFATLGLFLGIRLWGVGPTITVVAATPILNLIFAFFRRRMPSGLSMVGVLLVFVGVLLTSRGGTFHLAGFGWALFGTLMNAILMELFDRSKTSSAGKSLCGLVGMGTLGLVLSALPYAPEWPRIQFSGWLVPQLIGFAFIGGFVYWIANIKVIQHLPTVEGTTLLQLEALTVIFGGMWMLNERLNGQQWFGVALVLTGAILVARALARGPKQIWYLQVIYAPGAKPVSVESVFATTEAAALQMAQGTLSWDLVPAHEARIICPDGVTRVYRPGAQRVADLVPVLA